MGRPRPNLVELQSQRFKCRQLLIDFCALYHIGARDLTDKGNFANVVRLRRRFIRFAYDSGCGLTAIGSVIKRDTSTVDYHVRGVRKRRRERVAAYDAARRAVPEPAAHV